VLEVPTLHLRLRVTAKDHRLAEWTLPGLAPSGQAFTIPSANSSTRSAASSPRGSCIGRSLLPHTVTGKYVANRRST
jgi:hypothetical protein